MLLIFPIFIFSGIAFITRHLKHPERQKNRKYDRYFWGRVSKNNFRGEMCSFWRIGCAMLDDMKLNKMETKFSSAIAALDDLLAVTIYGRPQDSKNRDHGI